jgi:hypothetical protein
MVCTKRQLPLFAAKKDFSNFSDVSADSPS